MGLWNNTAFVRHEDLDAVGRALTDLVVAEGRVPVTPQPRTRRRYEEMQYGTSDEVQRWGFALFPGAPGWAVVKTAPLELLLYGEREPRLATLTRRLGCEAFQHNVYDGDSTLLFEADHAGRTEITGFCGQEPERFYGDSPPEERAQARFALLDVRADVQRARRENVRWVGGILESSLPLRLDPREAAWRADRRRKFDAWLAAAGGRTEIQRAGAHTFTHWRASAADIVEDLLGPDPVDFDAEVLHEALVAVFGGARGEEVTDNLVSVQQLVSHEPLSVKPSRTLYFDRTSG